MDEDLTIGLASVATAIRGSADAVSASTAEARHQFNWLRNGIIVLAAGAVVGLLGIFAFAQHRASESEQLARDAIEVSHLSSKQSECSWKVQGHYIKQIGLLADSNGASLRGETPDPVRNKARVEELRKASEYVDRIDEICFTPTPDPTPLDGVLPDGRVVVIPN